MALKRSRQSSNLTGVENRPTQKTRQSNVLPLASQRIALNEIGNIVRQQNVRASICMEISKDNFGTASKSRIRRSTRLSVAAQLNGNQPWKVPRAPAKPKEIPAERHVTSSKVRMAGLLKVAAHSALDEPEHLKDSTGPGKRNSMAVKRAPRLTMKPPPVETPPEERMAVQNIIRQSLAAERNRRLTLAAPSPIQNADVDIGKHEKKKKPDIPTKDDIDLAHRRCFWMMTTYSKRIYSYLRKLDWRESMKMKQEQLNVKVTTRTKLVEWMASAYLQLHLLQETFQLSVSILDRYLLRAINIKDTKLELVAVTCLSLSIKYEELLTSLVQELLSLSSRPYSLKEFIEMEAEVIKVLSFQVARPIPLVFLRRYNTAAKCDRTQHSYGKYLIDLAQLDPTLAHLPASSLAAATVFVGITLKGLRVNPESWSRVMCYYTALTFNDIKPVVSQIATLVLPGGPQCHSLRRKYAAEASFLSTDRVQRLLLSLCDLSNSYAPRS